jgi:N-methylhydantoinase A
LVTRLDKTTTSAIEDAFQALESEARVRLLDQGFTADQIGEHRRSVDMRYHGQEHTVRVPVPAGALDLAAIETGFHEHHRRSYTFALVGTPVEIVNFRTISTIEMPRPAMGRMVFGGGAGAGTASSGSRRVDLGDGVRHETAVFSRAGLPAGFAANGPAIVEEASATTLVLPGQRLAVDRFGNLVISPDH